MSNGTGYNITGNQEKIGLVTFATSSTAISIVGGYSATVQGMMYAVNGGAQITNGGYFNGGILAGGTGTNGGILASGGAIIDYPSGLMSGLQIIPGSGQSGVTSWIQM